MVSLAGKLRGKVEIFIKNEDLDRVLPSLSPAADKVVHEIGKTEKYKLIVVDQRETDESFYRDHLSGNTVVAIDEGGSLRNKFPYLIDILPLPQRFGSPNFKSLSFLDLPEPEEKAEKNGKVLISFGGEDPAGLTEKICRIIGDQYIELIPRVTVVLGPQYRGTEPDSRFEVIRNPESLKKILPQYNGVICSYGLTAYEALSLDIPFILANPAEYHEELTSLCGFPTAGVAIGDREKLISFIERPDNYITESPDFNGPTMEDFISSLEPSGKDCPVCRSADFEVEARFEHKTYCRCSRCSMLFMINFQKEKMSYSEEYFFDQYEKQYGKTYLDDFDHLSRLADSRLRIISRLIKSATSVLDVGCAYGPFLKKAEQYGYEPFGTDISDDAVRYVEMELGFPVMPCRFEDFLIPGTWNWKYFDVLTMWYVIEHFSQLSSILRKVNSLIMPGGIFAFSTPSGSGVSALKDRFEFLRNSPDDHYTVWEPCRSGEILEKFGFKIEKIYVTGHHPERFASPLARFGAGRKLLSLYSRIYGLGDTYEIYARKVRDL